MDDDSPLFGLRAGIKFTGRLRSEGGVPRTIPRLHIIARAKQRCLSSSVHAENIEVSP